jgi:hypothetical protein
MLVVVKESHEQNEGKGESSYAQPVIGLDISL